MIWRQVTRQEYCRREYVGIMARAEDVDHYNYWIKCPADAPVETTSTAEHLPPDRVELT